MISMSEFRHDPLAGYWVIVAEDRSERPQDFKIEQQVQAAGPCPFCAGHERETPREVMVTRDANDESSWQIRVVPNKYPALDLKMPEMISSQPTSSLPSSHNGELFETLNGTGMHEVIIETPQHLIRTTDLAPQQLSAVLRVYRDRLRELRQNQALRCAVIFKNVGPEAGATIEHTHSQLLGLPIVAPLLAAESAATEKHYRRHGSCLLCDLIAAEEQLDRRVVSGNDHYLAICPYAGRQPCETWILPRAHQADFDALDDDACDQLAAILLDILQAIDQALAVPAYNYLIQTAPFDSDSERHYHWRMVIVPRLTVRDRKSVV
jgi:UDPglucose--hexose-1-phosphate uridylyltransferase